MNWPAGCFEFEGKLFWNANSDSARPCGHRQSQCICHGVKPPYIKDTGGICPDRDRVWTWGDCKIKAAELGLNWTKFTARSMAHWPMGCFHFRGQLWYNTDTTQETPHECYSAKKRLACICS